MFRKIAKHVKTTQPANEVEAHCDGPCGVYDPSSIRIAAEAAVSMTKKILAMTPPAAGDAAAWAAYMFTQHRALKNYFLMCLIFFMCEVSF